MCKIVLVQFISHSPEGWLQQQLSGTSVFSCFFSLMSPPPDPSCASFCTTQSRSPLLGSSSEGEPCGFCLTGTWNKTLVSAQVSNNSDHLLVVLAINLDEGSSMARIDFISRVHTQVYLHGDRLSLLKTSNISKLLIIYKTRMKSIGCTFTTYN